MFATRILGTLVFAALIFSQTVAQADYYGRSQHAPIISITISPQESLNSDLRIAARENRLKHLEALLKAGASANGVSEEGESALMYAASICNVQVGKTLLQHGAKVGLRDHKGKTALIYASMSSCSGLIGMMLKKPGANVFTLDKAGMSALDYARDSASLSVQGPPVDSLKMLEKVSQFEINRSRRLAINRKAAHHVLW